MSQAPAVDYAVQIIEFLSDGPGAFGITEISSALDIAADEADLRQIREELYLSGYLRQRGPAKKQKIHNRPMHFVSSDGYDIYVGNFETIESGTRYIYSQTWSPEDNYTGNGTLTFMKCEYDTGKEIEEFSYKVEGKKFTQIY